MCSCGDVLDDEVEVVMVDLVRFRFADMVVPEVGQVVESEGVDDSVSTFDGLISDDGCQFFKGCWDDEPGSEGFGVEGT